MSRAPVLTSLLETDLYKLTMWQALLHRHPATQADYRFVCRNPQAAAFPLAELRAEVEAELDHLCALSFTAAELDWLGRLRFIRPDFVDFLRIFRFQRAFISVRTEGDRLCIEARGPQVHVMGFEIPVLAIVNELYFRRLDRPAVREEGRRRLAAKIERLQRAAADPAAARRFPFELFEFGLRRRFSADWQREMLETLAARLPGVCRATSNVHLARTLGLTPIGTMAHEYLQTYQG
ncbi:MAG: nicotinate phosphoribosyltransferase, partial [Pseudomonadota bacterium]